jgi:hypothetical protein
MENSNENNRDFNNFTNENFGNFNDDIKIKRNNNENFNSFNSYCDNIKDKDIEIYITIYMRIFKMLKIKIIKL